MTYFNDWGFTFVSSQGGVGLDMNSAFLNNAIGNSFPRRYYGETKTLILSSDIELRGVEAAIVSAKTLPRADSSGFYLEHPDKGKFYHIFYTAEVKSIRYFTSNFVFQMSGSPDVYPQYKDLRYASLLDLVDWSSQQMVRGHPTLGDTVVSKASDLPGMSQHNYDLGGGSNRFWGGPDRDWVKINPHIGDVNQLSGREGVDKLEYRLSSGGEDRRVIINGGISGKAGGDTVGGFEWLVVEGNASYDIRLGRIDTPMDFGSFSTLYKKPIPATWTLLNSARSQLVATEASDYISTSPIFSKSATIYAKGGNDVVWLYSKSSRADGGKGVDHVGVGDKKHYQFDYLGSFTKKLADTSLEFRIQTKGSNIAQQVAEVRDFEYVVYNRSSSATPHVTAPLIKWHFVIERRQDGACTIELFENGESQFEVRGWYDDATPIPQKEDGFYEGWYRPDGKLGKVIQFETLGEPARKNIQIHGGDHIGYSEGCFTIPLPQLNQMRRLMDDAFSGATLKATPGRGYDLPVPITIDVRTYVPQPKVDFAVNNHRLYDDDTNTEVNPLFLSNFGANGITRKVDFFFRVEQGVGRATLGSDFTIDNAEKIGSNKFKLTLQPGKTQLPIQYTVLGDKPGARVEADERIDITIYDVNIWRSRPETGGGFKWVEYDESVKSRGTTSSPEQLLLGGKTLDLHMMITGDQSRKRSAKQWMEQDESASGGDASKAFAEIHDRAGDAEWAKSPIYEAELIPSPPSYPLTEIFS